MSKIVHFTRKIILSWLKPDFLQKWFEPMEPTPASSAWLRAVSVCCRYTMTYLMIVSVLSLATMLVSGCPGDLIAVCSLCSQPSTQLDCCKSLDITRLCVDEEQDKRTKFPLGKRSIPDDSDGDIADVDDGFETELDNEKRRSPFLGKRRNPFLGKRRSPFLGKRRNPFLGKREDDLLTSYDKRRMPFLGWNTDSKLIV